MLKLVQKLNQFRHQNSALHQDIFWDNQQCQWYKPDGGVMHTKDWQYFVRAISCRITNKEGNLFFIFNAYHEKINWKLPNPTHGKKWRVAIATEQVNFRENSLNIPPWSVVAFQEVKKN